jgi:hypothetical protein
MIKYIKNNLTPLLIGATIGLVYCITLHYFESIILKLAMISYGE